MNHRQLSSVHDIASEYWGRKVDHIDDLLTGLTIINSEPYKLVGFLPEYQQFPSVLFKIFKREFDYQNEINGYKLANTIAPIGDITTPEILRILPDHSAVLIKKIPMQDTLREIRRLSYRNSKVNWINVGKWLRAFHETELLSKDKQKFFDDLHYRVDKHLKKVGHYFQTAQIEMINDLKRSTRDYMDQHTIEWENMHGDFNIDSIKISLHATYIIDFERLTVAPRRYEVISFLAALQFSSHFIYRKEFFSCLSNDFLKGYGVQIEPTPLNNYFYLKTILDLIAYCHFRESTSKSFVKKLGYNLLKNDMIKATYKLFEMPLESWMPFYTTII